MDYTTLLLVDFSVIKPDPGLIFWTLIVFVLVWTMLAKLAFKPMQEALKQRENDIQSALDQAKLAREEMANLKAENLELLRQAQEERTKILKEAKEAKDAIIAEAREKAQDDARKIVDNAKESIENQSRAAMIELQNQVGILSVDIAEKLLRRELEDKGKQEAFVNSLIKDIKMN
jgi:F-type H+-transporting ATPase subunit b